MVLTSGGGEGRFSSYFSGRDLEGVGCSQWEGEGTAKAMWPLIFQQWHKFGMGVPGVGHGFVGGGCREEELMRKS